MAVKYSEDTRTEHIYIHSDKQHSHRKTSEERIEIRIKILQERKEAFNILAKY